MKQKIMMLVMSLAFIGTAFAHEGHNKTPGSIAAPHGGVIKGTNQLYIELVSDASGIKLYPLTHDLTAISTNDVKLVASSQVPKKKKENVKLSQVGDHYEAIVDAKGAYHYSFSLEVSYKSKTEKVLFQVEPQN